MKLFELGASKPSQQAAKVFESYFGDSINVDIMSPRQAEFMLNKVRKLVSEARRQPSFHQSEKNPTYLKLMMMERVLTAKLGEVSTIPVGATGGATVNQAQTAGQNAMVAPNATVAAGQAMAAKKLQQIKDPKSKQALQKAQAGQNLSPQEQQLLANVALTTESKQLRHQLYRVLKESEVLQAQVVLAAQDMVDQIQKMSEQVSSMQFKDLPALVDQIKNQVGVDQAMQFNTDATSALAGLLQNLQTSKQQMDAALATVTGQTPPPDAGAADMGGMDMGADMGGEPDLGGDLGGDMGAELPPEEPELPAGPEAGGAELGRAKR